MFGGYRKKKTSLAGRVKKLERQLAKKKRIADLKRKEELLRKQLSGY